LTSKPKTKPEVLCSMRISDEAQKKLEEVAEVETRFTVEFLSSKEELLKVIDLFDGVIIAASEPFDREVINAGKRLKVISRVGVGYDNVDVKAAVERGIYVTVTPVNAETVADTAFGLIFAVARKIPQAHLFVKDGEWSSGKPVVSFMGFDVFGKTMGIIGLGRIGSVMAKRARGFDMPVLYYDMVRNKRLEKDLGIKFVSLEDLLLKADIVTIHVPLNEKTRGMIGEEQLKTMKRTAILINTARGPIVDEATLCKALKEGWIAGAGLDVFAHEPVNAGNPLLTLENTVYLPHLGSATFECRKRMYMMGVENTIRVLGGEKPLHYVTS
jgi:D-3-phosphoglycerate dehydrogenase